MTQPTREQGMMERLAIVEWLCEAGNHDADQYGEFRRCVAADQIERGDHLAILGEGEGLDGQRA